MNQGDLAKKRMAQQKGRNAENLAALFLRFKGYSILARRFKTRQGEIDLIIRRGGNIAFVEVKSRLDTASAAAAISLRQRRRIEAAASIYLSKHPELSNLTCRFDAILLEPFSFPTHLLDAWRPGESYS